MARNEYEPTNLEVLMSLLEKTGTAGRRGAGKTVSIRIDSVSLATVDALATIAEKSRNSLLLHLISVGLEQVYAAANEETKERVEELRVKALTSYLSLEESDAEVFEDQGKEPLHGNAHA